MKQVMCPYKVIMFGEHTVVYGGSALSSSIDLFAVTELSLTGDMGVSSKFVDGTLRYLGKPLRSVSVNSDIPPRRGFGSSSVVVSSILKLYTDGDKPEIARKAFEIERKIQGSGSPIDTTTVVQGGMIAINSSRGSRLWEIKYGGASWKFSTINAGNVNLLIVDTGERATTETMVAQVKGRIQNKNEKITRISDLSNQGIRAFQNKDFEEAGFLMSENHTELQQLDISTKLIDKIVDIGKKHAFGAKLSGAGGGGIVVILTREETKAQLKKELGRVNGIVVYDTNKEEKGIRTTGS